MSADRWPALLVLAALTAGRPVAAGPCDPPNTIATFDPRTTTGVVSGASFGPIVVFSSPKNPDPSLVYHVGSPGGDGCVAGIRPGSPVPSGTLKLTLSLLFCVQFDVHATLPYMVEAFDAQGIMVSGGVSSAPSFGWAYYSPPALEGSSIVLTPGRCRTASRTRCAWTTSASSSERCRSARAAGVW